MKIYILRTVGDSCCGAFENLKAYKDKEEVVKVCTEANEELRSLKDAVREAEGVTGWFSLPYSEREERRDKVCSNYPTVMKFVPTYPNYCDGFEIEELDLL